MQKEPPPSSSAWCWQTLKFITQVVYWVGERERHSRNHSRVEEMSICLIKWANLKDTENKLCVCLFFVNLFYVVKERESAFVSLRLPVPAAVSVALLFRCHTQPTQARSSLRPLALAPLSWGYCTAAEKADKTHHSHLQRHFLPTSHIAIPSTICGRHLNLI